MTRGSIIFSALQTSRTSPIGGVQTWMDTMDRALTDMGFEVTLWSPHDPIPDRTFDYHVMAHRAGLDIKAAKRIGISHGIIREEKPASGIPYIATSEEVRDHWELEGPILRQPIDLGLWQPHFFKYDRKVIHFDYRSECDLARKAAGKLGFKYERITNQDQRGCYTKIGDAEVVLATGRAALEASAMGRPVLIYANSPFYGRAVDPCYKSAMRHNYSARGGCRIGLNDLALCISQAIERGGWRSQVVEHHDHRKIAAQLVEILES